MPTRPPRAHTTGSAAPTPRVSARKRGYDTKWEQARRGFLAKHRFCECPAHKGKLDAPLATVVHHITPHKGDRALFWLRSNWMPMAKPCHDTHTGRYDRPSSPGRGTVPQLGTSCRVSPPEDACDVSSGGDIGKNDRVTPGGPAVPIPRIPAGFANPADAPKPAAPENPARRA